MTRKYLRIDGIQIGSVPLTPSGNAITTSGPIDLSNSTIAWSSVTSRPTNVSEFANDANYASVGYVDNSISTLVASAPETLNTLNELALALNNDASFTTTITALIGTKANTASLSNVAFTGNYADLLNKPNEVGYTGSAGTSGTNGYTGSIGTVGYTGSAGSQGPMGYTGSKGDTGTTGATGPQGVQGIQGTTGYTGSAGPVAGTNTQVIFNDGGIAAGSANFTFDKTNNTLIVTGTSGTGVSALDVGVPNTELPNTVSSFTANVNSYTQVTLQNKSTGADATADYIITADNGSDTTNYFDLGIINSGYDNATPTNSLGNLVYAADSYIYAQGSVSNQPGGNLAIGTTTVGKTIKLFAGGVSSSALIATVSSSGVTMNSGNISGNTNGFAIGYRDIPQVSFAASATMALADAGKHYYSTSASNLTLTVPTNTSVAFNTGATINVINQGTGTITINPSSGVSMYLAGNSTSASRTLSSYGLATITKVATDTWFIAGVGLT